MNFEQGHSALEDLVEWANQNDWSLERNEAQTRFDLIDKLLAALDWASPDVRVEVHQNRTYTDYELGSPTRLLLEAKREDTYFVLPAGWHERIAKISTVVQNAPDIADALKQALAYANQRGVPYAAVCNGWQLIAFIASRTDGIPPLEGNALVFSSLEWMRDDFRTLWDNLSRPGITDDNLHRSLAGRRVVSPPARLASKIPSYPGVARRREAQQTLQILGSVFVEDLASAEDNERRFLLSCYSHSGALSQYAMVSKEILRTRYSLLFEDTADYTITAASTHAGLDPNLFGDIAAASLKHRPILLLGDVGVGKSTFIKNLIHVDAKKLLESAIVFYLDFGKRPALTTDLAQHVRNELERQLQRDHHIDVTADAFVRGVYHGKLEQFRTSIYAGLRETDADAFTRHEIDFLTSLIGDVDEHMRASLDHISKAHRKQVVVFLDNVDQRDASFQNDLFVIGQTMAESWPVTVFLALRPETFYESRRTGALAAYQPRAFSISPPRVEVVLKKRLAYALEVLKEGGLRTGAGVEISIDLTTLTKYLDTIQRSLQINTDLMDFLENVSNGNIRDALSYLEAYIGSPHVNLDRMLQVMSKPGGSFVIPLQDLVKSVLLGEGEFYDASRSALGNLFDTATPSRAEHFLVPMLIEFLQAEGAGAGADGFVEVDQIYGFAQPLGFQIDSIAAALERAMTWRFVARAGFDRHGRKRARAFRVTTCGVYAVRKLCRTFTYLDAVIDDTPIADPKLFAKLQPLSHSRDTPARLARAEVFISYLSEAWNGLTGPTPTGTFDWPSAAHEALLDIERIRRTLERRASER